MEFKSSDSEYIEMTRQGLDIEIESVYDVIPADDHDGKHTHVSNDTDVYLTPASCQRLYEPSAITQNKGQGTTNHSGGSRIKLYLLIGCGMALVCLSVGITLVTIYTVNVMKETDPGDNNKPDPDFDMELDIRKLVKAALFTNTAINYHVLKLLPPYLNPLDFTFEVFNADRIPFRVNERGIVLVKGALTATEYEFIVKITNQRSRESVLVTVIVRCRDPNGPVLSSVESDKIGIISFSSIYSHSGVSNIPLTSNNERFPETYFNWISSPELAISPSEVRYSTHQMSPEITTDTKTTQFLATNAFTTFSVSSIFILDSFDSFVSTQEPTVNSIFYTAQYHILSPSFNEVTERRSNQYTYSLTPSLSSYASTISTIT